MTYRIAFGADFHLGYRARMKNNERGVNLRVQDGYDAATEIIRDVIEHDPPIDAMIHGGDFFHVNHPTVMDIATGNFLLRKLAEAGIPFYGVGGNHDSSNTRGEISAGAAIDDRERKLHTVYNPYEKFEITDGIMLHAVSHHGLHKGHAPEVEVSSDVINIFTTHGAAIDPKNQTLLRCMDSPNEQIIPMELITDEMFNINLLGHYHNRYAVGHESLNTWYAGSTVRRGFSDDAGPRGWLLVEVEPSGEVTVTPKNITQRPQFDLPAIDAADLTVPDIMDILEINLEKTTGYDKEPIVRQRFVNLSRINKDGLDHDRIQELTKHLAVWQPEYVKPQLTKQEESAVEVSLQRGRAVNIIDNYKRFTEAEAENIPEEYRDIVFKAAEEHLARAREAAESKGLA